MTHLLGFSAYLLLPLIGIAIWRLPDVRTLTLDGRLTIAGVTGALITSVVMSAMALLGIEWSRTRLVAALGVIALAGLWRWKGSASTPLRGSFALFGVFVLTAITVYGLITARETIGDLLFFWGPKGVHFFRAGTIDVAYLRDPNSFLTHRDYPPLLPLLFAFSHSLSRQFSWWAAVLLSGLCFAGVVALVRGGSRSDLPALLTASILAWAFGWAQIAGGADPLLLLFEATAVTALVFFRDETSQVVVAAIGVAGAVVTKVEGASFAVALLLALLIERRPLRRIATILLPAVLLLGGWLLFVVRAGLLDTYRGPGELSFRFFEKVLAATFTAANYNAYWIPWIAPLIVIFLGDYRRARLPLTIAVLTAGATLYVYLRSPTDPSVFWIPSSAQRVLLTPLVMLLIAAAAAHSPGGETSPQRRQKRSDSAGTDQEGWTSS